MSAKLLISQGPRMNKRLSTTMATLGCLGLLAGCTTGKDYTQPNLPQVAESQLLSQQDGQQNSLQDSQQNTQGEASKFSQQKPVSAWWDEFNDPVLSALVSQALSQNYDVRIARARIVEAREIAQITATAQLPSIDADLSSNRQRLSDSQLSDTSSNSKYTAYQTGFDASWELDLFGRIDAAVEADRLELESRQALARSVYVSVAAEVARNYVSLRGAQYRMQVAQRNLSNQQESLDLTKRLVEGGRNTELDIARAETLLQLTKASMPQLDTDIAIAKNRLAILTGQLSSDLVIPANSGHAEQPLPSLPASVSIGTTSSLLARRGDVASAERQLAQTTARYNVAVADLYPRITFNGSLGFLANDFSSLGDSGTRFSSFGPSLSWSVFNRKKLNANVRASDARIDMQLAIFEQSVMSALEEINNAMVSFSREEQRRESLRLAARSATEALSLARTRYEVGVDSYLTVLDAERTQLDTQDQLAVSETQVFTHLIAVYKALGGGWEVVAETAQ